MSKSRWEKRSTMFLVAVAIAGAMSGFVTERAQAHPVVERATWKCGAGDRCVTGESTYCRDVTHGVGYTHCSTMPPVE